MAIGSFSNLGSHLRVSASPKFISLADGGGSAAMRHMRALEKLRKPSRELIQIIGHFQNWTRPCKHTML